MVDQDARLCCSYVMNKMQPGVLGDPRGFGILQAAVTLGVSLTTYAMS